MSDEFNFAEVGTVADDFAARKEQYDVLMEDAVKDLTNAIKNVKSGRDASALSDDITGLMEEHGEKFGMALGSADKADREKWVPELTGILTKAMDMEPENVENIIRGAYQIEKAYEGADSGIFASVADKAMFRHRSYTSKIMAVVDESLQDYETQPHQDAATYRTFGKIYGSAFAKTGNKAYAEKANDILEKTELVKGNVTIEKLLKRLQENPSDEATQDKFEKNLELLLTAKPKAATEDILNNLKNVAKIGDSAVRDDVYCIMVSALNKHIKVNTPEEVQQKSGILFTAIDTIMKSEKDADMRKNVTVLAVNALSYMAIKDMPANESGALVIDSGKKQETFRALKKMADSYGNYVGLKDLIVNTASRYRKSPEITDELKSCMLRVLSYEEKNGITVEERSDFENGVLKQKKEQENKLRLDTAIYKLLNVPHKTNGYTKDAKKPAVPSKEDMHKVANLLCQYKIVEYPVFDEVINKIDKEKFSNVDDEILNKLEMNIGKMRCAEMIISEEMQRVTAIRTGLHKNSIQQKKELDNAPKQWHEKTAKKEPQPQKRISVSVKDLPDSLEK